MNKEILKKSPLLREYGAFLEKKASMVTTDEPGAERSLFLSVVIRTQGKRMETLKEVFLSLCAQTNSNFEVLLIGHKVDSIQEELLLDLVSMQPEELQTKICYMKVDYGNRTAPLNVGFTSAKGRYIVALDDDDVVFDDWVDTFYRLSQANNGKVLHAYCFVQDWESIKEGALQGGLRAAYKPLPQYCEPFDLAMQLYANRCPFMSVAFPAFVFQEFGEKFDETLDTTEDWDYLMRAVFLCGIADETNATSIYKLWKNTSNSSSEHDESVWKSNQEKVWAKLTKYPVLIDEDQVEKILRLSKAVQENENLGIKRERSLKERFLPKLYLDYGSGYNERDVEKTDNILSGCQFSFHYTITSADCLRTLRWDPCEDSNFLVKNLKIEVYYKDKTTSRVNVTKCLTNGCLINETEIAFLRTDPQICFKSNKSKEIVGVHVSGELVENISDEIYDKILKGNKVKRMLEKARWRFM